MNSTDAAHLPPEYEALLLPSWRSEAVDAERRKIAERNAGWRFEAGMWGGVTLLGYVFSMLHLRKPFDLAWTVVESIGGLALTAAVVFAVAARIRSKGRAA